MRRRRRSSPCPAGGARGRHAAPAATPAAGTTCRSPRLSRDDVWRKDRFSSQRIVTVVYICETTCRPPRRRRGASHRRARRCTTGREAGALTRRSPRRSPPRRAATSVAGARPPKGGGRPIIGPDTASAAPTAIRRARGRDREWVRPIGIDVERGNNNRSQKDASTAALKSGGAQWWCDSGTGAATQTKPEQTQKDNQPRTTLFRRQSSGPGSNCHHAR